MRTARATRRSMVASNSPITQAARNAVARLIDSHRARCRAVTRSGANMSCSSSRPAADRSVRSFSSRIRSTTSSMVIRPISRPVSSTTGAEIRSRCSNRTETSVSGVSAGIGRTSGVHDRVRPETSGSAITRPAERQSAEIQVRAVYDKELIDGVRKLAEATQVAQHKRPLRHPHAR